ncbi:uracil-DNA glycosylase [Winogradskyella sp. KYW1333]|jgi:uracil-DNA glycosylase|uniref:uracil-DNA glycosylase n=1 Tax=Winogradskyella sp. KYW1333 TaxID=2282123 RepID=UPI000DF164B7|nr:uracil-DNA glycosylase [Winogradskyella sp. KYW1333]RCT54190.1 uracil-DNA glycosylase [Winogradskyella sp. KYW1333]
MNVSIGPSWKQYLQAEFDKSYFKSLAEFVKAEYKNYTCFPKGSQIFNAFNHCSFEAVKVVIIGQDPYHGIGQANGLCFSVNDGIQHPPSLKNILKELEDDLNINYPVSGNLEKWADQGVLLLNATLTVRANQAGSHQKKGWETFTDKVIEIISDNKENVVFMLWGGYANKKKKLINTNNHFVLETGHPSPLSANRGYWFGNKQFSTTNSLLLQAGLSAIEWSLK